MLSIVLVGALLTYGGVSLFVVVFAVYPFAAEMFRQADIPKRLIPARSRWGLHLHHGRASRARHRSRTSSRRPSSRPTPGPRRPRHDRGGLHPRRRDGLSRMAPPAGRGGGRGLRRRATRTSPSPWPMRQLAHPAIAILPLVVVGVMNNVLTVLIARVLRRHARGHACGDGEAARHAGLLRRGDLGGRGRPVGRHPDRAASSPSGR